MHPIIEEYFASVGVEDYTVRDYASLRVTAPEIAAREPFEPKSVILFVLPYYTGTPKNISRYAASLDYHLGIRRIGEGLIGRLREAFPDAHFKIYGDHSPINEVHAALTSGLGIAGDNGLLIHKKYGSYIFLADLICDLPVEVLGEETIRPIEGCLHCGACRRACPTGILRGEGTDCLSAITQRKGELTEAEQELMRRYHTAWGCDLCQSVCPYNRDPVVTPISFFHEERIEELTSELLASMSKQDFQRRAFAWRGRKVVERNLKILEE